MYVNINLKKRYQSSTASYFKYQVKTKQSNKFGTSPPSHVGYTLDMISNLTLHEEYGPTVLHISAIDPQCDTNFGICT